MHGTSGPAEDRRARGTARSRCPRPRLGRRSAGAARARAAHLPSSVGASPTCAPQHRSQQAPTPPPPPPPSAPRRRDQVSRVSRVVAELSTQVLHVSIDRPLVTLVVVALNPRDELVARVDPPRTGGERDQEVELAPREFHDRAAHVHLVRIRIDPESTLVEGERLRQTPP